MRSNEIDNAEAFERTEAGTTAIATARFSLGDGQMQRATAASKQPHRTDKNHPLRNLQPVDNFIGNVLRDKCGKNWELIQNLTEMPENRIMLENGIRNSDSGSLSDLSILDKKLTEIEPTIIEYGKALPYLEKQRAKVQEMLNAERENDDSLQIERLASDHAQLTLRLYETKALLKTFEKARKISYYLHDTRSKALRTPTLNDSGEKQSIH